MHKLALTKDAVNFLDDLQAKQYKQVMGKIVKLLIDPSPSDSEIVKGYDHQYRRASIGEFRIAYKFENDTIGIVMIGKRNDDDVYKRLERK